MPVEVVVPGLRRVVEERGAVRNARAGAHDLLQRLALDGVLLQKLVRLVDVELVMLAVMQLQRVGGNHGRERVLRVRQRRQRKMRCGMRFADGGTFHGDSPCRAGIPAWEGASAVPEKPGSGTRFR